MMLRKFLIAANLITFSSVALAAEINDVAQNRNVSPFNGIQISGSYSVKITSGDSKQLVQILASNEEAKCIETVVENKILIIKYKSSASRNCKKTYNVIINAPMVNRLSLAGSYLATATHIDTDNYRIATAGNGEVILAGKVNNMTTSLSGTTRLDAKSLHIRDNLDLQSRGVANVDVSMQDNAVLTGSPRGSGVVKIYGKIKMDDYKQHGTVKTIFK
jgi:hypothetical protein